MNEVIKDRNLYILIIISILTLILIKIKDKENHVAAFNENNTYDLYIIDLKDKYVTTKNINDYISDEIEEIYPYIDKKYSNVINSSWYKIDKLINEDKNIKNLEENYKKIFYKNALREEVIYIDLNGLKISKVKILTNNIDKYKNFKVQKVYIV